jgi:flagellar biosynthetic protein FliQ
MDQDIIITLLQKTFVLILELSAPVLIVSIAVGLLISVFQTVTQIQESTLTFVPKLIAAIVTLIILMPWMISIFISTVNELFNSIPQLIFHT